DCRPAAEAQRNHHDREQVHHGDVDQVEARPHREPGQRACGARAGRPRISRPRALLDHGDTVAQARRKGGVKRMAAPLASPAADTSLCAMKSTSTAGLTLLALGVVYGDIGTRPLYAVKETFNPEHGIPLTAPNILGGLSAIFWSLMVIVSLKYVTL